MFTTQFRLLAGPAFVLPQGSFPPGSGNLPNPAMEARRRFRAKEAGWIIGIFLGLIVLFVVGLFVLLSSSEVFQRAVQQAQSNPAVVERLGQPIRRGLLFSGNIKISGSSGHADFAIPLSGPKGKGTLYGVATRSAGVWKFETLQFAIEGESQRINLLEDNSQPPPPPPEP